MSSSSVLNKSPYESLEAKIIEKAIELKKLIEVREWLLSKTIRSNPGNSCPVCNNTMNTGFSTLFQEDTIETFIGGKNLIKENRSIVVQNFLRGNGMNDEPSNLDFLVISDGCKPPRYYQLFVEKSDEFEG